MTLEAYCHPASVAPGDPVRLHVSSSVPDVDVEVSRQGAFGETRWRGRIRADEHATPTDASERGCGWPVAVEIPTDAGWSSGFHAISLSTAQERTDAFVVVRPPLDRPAPILLVLSTATYAAYNDWGGPSLYTGATRVSLERPLAPGFLRKPEPALRKAQAEVDREALGFFRWAEPRGLSVWSGGSGWWNWERPFLSWAEAAGFEVDVAVSEDLELHPAVLDGHRLLLSVGHDEYWSAGMRDAVEAFLERGGNAAFFSGNTCFWQVRPEDGFRAITCFKYRVEDDPVLGTEDEHLLTGIWSDPRTRRPEASMIGLSFTRGGYSRYGLGVPRPSGAYTVWRPEHWAFEGTALRYGDALGLADTIVGYEVDGCELALEHGRPVPTFADGAPDSLEVLATAPAKLWSTDEQPSRYAGEPGDLEFVARSLFGEAWRDEIRRIQHNHAVVAAFEHPGGGTVFNAGCTDWAYGLAGEDPDVARITRNVLERLSR
ncbi:MAG TPA: N,N-dimethylformamidase beta subunit family domain-containing protein [Actinomycetota bacterium]|nr:N,N-dimethylformamidase beta subunit family domain-containing protein [Actinomycetota bacterium]